MGLFFFVAAYAGSSFSQCRAVERLAKEFGQVFCVTAGAPNRIYCSADLVKNAARFFGSELFDRLFFDGTKSHQVLAKVPKRLWIPAAAHGFVVFQNALRKSGTTELNVAGDRQFRQFMCEPVDLPAPVRVQ